MSESGKMEVVRVASKGCNSKPVQAMQTDCLAERQSLFP